MQALLLALAKANNVAGYVHGVRAFSSPSRVPPRDVFTTLIDFAVRNTARQCTGVHSALTTLENHQPQTNSFHEKTMASILTSLVLI